MALDQPPKASYATRCVVISVEDQCEGGAEECEVVWHFTHEEIAMLRAALSAEHRLSVLEEAVQYAVNRLDHDPRGPSQPQVAADLAVALAYSKSKT